MNETPAVFEIDQRVFRDVLGHYPTGVVAVTGVNPAGTPIAMVVGTFSSVSLEPPLVSFMPTKGSETYAALRECSTLVINVLAHDQQGETRALAQRDPNKFDKVKWELSEHGVPKIDNAVAHIHCKIDKEIEAGDHLFVLCAVTGVEVSRPVTPLLFFQGGYGGFSATTSAAYVDADLVSAVRLAEVASDQLATLSERFDCEAVAMVQINDQDQIIGSAARTSAVQTHERLAVRMALVPPMGDVAVAWNEEKSEKWLGRLFPRDPELIAKFEDRLKAVRELGYSTHVVPSGTEEAHKAFTEALHEYALGQLTPARDRAVKGVMMSAGDFYLTEPLDAAASERVVSITVPVFDPASAEKQNSGLSLRLSFERVEMSGAEVAERVEALKAAAAEVQAELAGSAASELERYRASGLV